MAHTKKSKINKLKSKKYFYLKYHYGSDDPNNFIGKFKLKIIVM